MKRLPPAISLLTKVWPPMLATLAGEEDISPDYDVLETKYDGFRGLAAVVKGEAALQSRNALDLSARFPGVAKALEAIGRECVLDGELIARSGRGFHSLQLGAGEIDYALFDLLWLDGEDLRPLPLRERRLRLEDLSRELDSARLRLSEPLPAPIHKALAAAKKRGLEGVVCKRGDSPYRGERGRDWLKVKLWQADEFVIAGYVPSSTGLKQIGALVLLTRDKKPRFAGKVGTGFTDASREQLHRLLSPLRSKRPESAGIPRDRDIVWVSPVHIAEVAYSERTPDGRLRHPSFQRLREDKEG